MTARGFFVQNWKQYPAIMKANIVDNDFWEEILGLAEAFAKQRVEQAAKAVLARKAGS